MKRWRAHLFPWISGAYLTFIYGLPTASALALMKGAVLPSLWLWIAAPILWALVFLILAGALSLPHQFAVVAGKVRRDVSNRLYFHRRLYGLCWTAVFYNKPVYFLCLNMPFLRWMVFRLFGYRGSMNFTVYPDTWIRDLPLLYFEDGVYVSNRATLGTNMVLSNGFLLVDGITLRANALVGHLVMLAPGVTLERGAEVGVGSAIGIRTTLEAGAFVGPCCVIEHGVRICKDASVSAHSYVGSRARVSEGVQLPPAAKILPRTTVSDVREGEPVEAAHRAFVRRPTAAVPKQELAGVDGMRGGTMAAAKGREGFYSSEKLAPASEAHYLGQTGNMNERHIVHVIDDDGFVKFSQSVPELSRNR